VLASAMYYLSVTLLFFFQAEDGIRDFHVTGVQTCALSDLPDVWGTASTPTVNGISNCTKRYVGRWRWGRRVWINGWRCRRQTVRSEERRVGKECRSRWSREHEKQT